MPQLIEHIDAIARKKQRDVLYLSFYSPESGHASMKSPDISVLAEKLWKQYAHRQELLTWLDSQNIAWKPCGPNRDLCRIGPYEGDIYIDIPIDAQNELFMQLSAHLENTDGSMRIPGVNFWVFPLEKALENSQHDDPAFVEANSLT